MRTFKVWCGPGRPSVSIDAKNPRSAAHKFWRKTRQQSHQPIGCMVTYHWGPGMVGIAAFEFFRSSDNTVNIQEVAISRGRRRPWWSFEAEGIYGEGK